MTIEVLCATCWGKIPAQPWKIETRGDVESEECFVFMFCSRKCYVEFLVSWGDEGKESVN